MVERTDKRGLSRHWTKGGSKAMRRFSLANPAAVLKFVTEVADAAELLGHPHPEIATVEEEVTISIALRDPVGLTERDVALTAMIDRIARAHFCS